MQVILFKRTHDIFIFRIKIAPQFLVSVQLSLSRMPAVGIEGDISMGMSYDLVVMRYHNTGLGSLGLSCTGLIQMSRWTRNAVTLIILQMLYKSNFINWLQVNHVSSTIFLMETKVYRGKYCKHLNRTYLQLTFYQFQCSTTEKNNYFTIYSLQLPFTWYNLSQMPNYSLQLVKYTGKDTQWTGNHFHIIK